MKEVKFMKFIIFLAVALVIIFSGWAYLQISSLQNDGPVLLNNANRSDDVDRKSTTTTKINNTSEFNLEIITEENAKEVVKDECEERIDLNDEQRKRCETGLIYDAASNQKSLDICNLLEDASLRANCLDEIYMNKAIDEDNVELCQKLSNKEYVEACSDEVYFKLAYYEEDNAEEYCAQIINESLRKTCEDRIK